MPTNPNEQDVQITAESSSFNHNMARIIELYNKLQSTLGGIKRDMESMNEVFDEASSHAKGLSEGLKEIKGLNYKPPKPPQGLGGNRSQELTHSQRILQHTRELNQLENIRHQRQQRNLQLMRNTSLNLFSAGSGRMGFNNILRMGFDTASEMSSRSFQGIPLPETPKGAVAPPAPRVAGATASQGTAATATGVATGAASGVGASVGVAALGVAALVVGIVALTAAMVKLGKEGSKTKISIANSQNVLGSSFSDAYDFAKKLNHEMGIAIGRSMKLITSVAQVMKASGMNSQSATFIGQTATLYASNIAAKTGADIQGVTEAIAKAVATGEDALGQFGIHMHDNAVKAWMHQTKGIDAFNVAISESNMQKYRYLYLTEMMDKAGYTNAQTNNTLAASINQVRNTWGSLVENTQATFIPVFQVVLNILESVSSAMLKVNNAVRQFFGYDPINIKADGVNQAAIDSVQDLYSGYRQLGDELDKLKGSLMSFDELENITSFNPEMGNLAELDMAAVKDTLGEQAKLLDNTERVANVYNEKLANATKRTLDAVTNILPKVIREPVREFFNLDNNEWDEMTNRQKMLSDPMKWYIELVESGDATGWDLLKALALEGLHKFPLIAAIKAALEGDMSGFIKKIAHFFMLGSPMTLPIAIAWSGIEYFKGIYDKFKTLDIKAGNIDLSKLKDALLKVLRDAWDSVTSSWSRLNPFNWGKGSSTPSQPQLSPIQSSRWTLQSEVPYPRYNNGGFHTKAHVGILDPGEVTIPLHGAAAKPAFQGIADRIMSAQSRSIFSGSDSVQQSQQTPVNLGSGNIFISDNTTFDRLVDKMWDRINQKMRSTGSFQYGSRL